MTGPTRDGQKLRLALCITELAVGGAERCLVDLATRLDRRRFEPSVVSLAPRPANTASSLVLALESAEIPVRFLDARGMADAPRVVARLAAEFRRQRPCVLQTFLHHANLVGRVAARLAGVPKLVCGIRVAERRGRWRLRADRWTSSLVDRYACVSQAVAEFSRTVGRLPPEKIVVIPNGIDVRRYDEALPADLRRFGVPRGRRVVAYVGRLDPQKRVGWLIDEAGGWLAQLPEHDLLIVGEGPDREALESLKRRKGLDSRVHLAGWQEDVPGILRSSDLVVLPSRWEGMPNVVLEAMASRLPVVATDVEGVRELLGPTDERQVSPVGDAAGFARRVAEILLMPGAAAALGATNRNRAEASFSLDAALAAYADLYESLVLDQAYSERVGGKER